jgi:hypothetical protein
MVLSVDRVSGSSDFTVLPAPVTPLAIAPGAQVDFTIEYDPNPTVHGSTETATIRITTDDPVPPLLDVVAPASAEPPRSRPSSWTTATSGIAVWARPSTSRSRSTTTATVRC